MTMTFTERDRCHHGSQASEVSPTHWVTSGGEMCSSGVRKPHQEWLQFYTSLTWEGVAIPKPPARKARRLYVLSFAFFRFCLFAFCFQHHLTVLPGLGLQTQMNLHLSFISKEDIEPSHGSQSHQRNCDLENSCLLGLERWLRG